MNRTRWIAPISLSAAALLLVAGAGAALAAGSGSIDHVENSHGSEQVLFSISGLPGPAKPDLSSIAVTIDGATVDATATSASDGGGLGRVAVLALDVSNSMRGKSFDEAKRAALAFVDQAPPDVEIGLVTFAGTVDTLQKPTTDRAALSSEINGLQLSGTTRLYEGVLAALAAAGADGQRQLLVLSDGADTTGVALSKVTAAVKRSGTRVDVVALSQKPDSLTSLSDIASSSKGTLVSANDPKALTGLFADEAQTLASQILVTFPVTPEQAGSGVDLRVGISAQGTTYEDAAFVSLGDAKVGPAPDPPATTPLPVSRPGFTISNQLLLVGIGAVGVGLLLLVGSALGVFRTKEPLTLEQRLSNRGGRGSASVTKAAPSVTVKESAVGLAQKALDSGGFEAKLALKLDAAGSSLKPAEWILMHVGIAFGAAVVGFMLSGGSIGLAMLLLLVGAVLPWIYLGFKQGRRVKAFNAQLGETLQLMAGGLSAGLSLTQAVDTIMREGTEPIAGEFRRALVEARLGVNIEEALDGVANRMSSKDFGWVVMAIRIQRTVGGNLSELLLTVSVTLRERDYLRRQVRSLSAEGRLSAWILCALPPLFMVYLAVTRGTYLYPMFHTTLGVFLLGVSAVLMSVGAFWMSKVVKVEV